MGRTVHTQDSTTVNGKEIIQIGQDF